MSGWPDKDKPGVPLHPERDGRHWLFDPERGKSYPEIWIGGLEVWAVGDAWTARMVAEMGLHYLGPVLTPAETDTLRAENARLRDALSGLMEGASAEEGWWTLIRAHSSTLDAARAALAGEVKL